MSWGETAAILDRLGEWMEATRTEVESLDPTSMADPAPAAADSASIGDTASRSPEPGIGRLVQEFTALRHEARLSARGARLIEEQAGELIRAVESALGHVRSIAPREAEAADRAVRPWLDAVMDLADSMVRSGRELERLKQQVIDSAIAAALERSDHDRPGRAGWLRWFQAGTVADRDRLRESMTASLAPLLDAWTSGHRMCEERLLSVIRREGLSRVECLGATADPRRVNVVELVERTDVPDETVVDEVRGGYEWKGQIVRFAEVVVARRPAAQRE
jgi:hypothetical protein